MWNLEKYINNTAILDDCGNALTYADLADAGSMLCSAASESLGNGNSRCLVFCMCENTVGSLVGYISFLNEGMVPVMLRRRMDDELLSALCVNYAPAYVWISKEDASRSTFIGMRIVFSEYDYVLLKTPYGAKAKLHPNLALLLTTSGSTGSSKLVRQSYNNIRSNTDSIVEYLHLDEAERPVTTLPMNYTYGISVINTHIDVGATILLTDKTLMQREFWQFIRDQHATSIAGVPYTYEMLKRLRFFSMDLPSLRTMTQAGGGLPAARHEEFARYAEDTGREFIVMYGACEATARMSWLPPERSLEKLGSVGIAIPGGRLELVDSKGAIIDGADRVGELVYYGSNVTMGYATSAVDLAKGDERHGRYETGDMARRDIDGYYYIVGRRKRFLKVYGNRVNLDDCERVLKEEFQGCEVACGGRDDKLYIFATREDLLLSMKSHLSHKTGLNASAFKIVLLEEMPKNESGKMLYGKLAEYYD